MFFKVFEIFLFPRLSINYNVFRQTIQVQIFAHPSTGAAHEPIFTLAFALAQHLGAAFLSSHKMNWSVTK